MAIKDWNGFKKSGDTFIPNDATARAGVTATVDLMKDTTGWTGKNKYKNTASSSTISSIPFVRNSDETWEVGTGTASADVWNNISGAFRLPEGKYRLSGCPEGGSGSTYFLYLRNNPQSTGDISVSEAGNGVEFTVTSELAQKDLVLFIAVKNGTTISNPVIFKPMICTVEQYALDPSYEPYHESVEEMLQNKVGDTIYLNHCILSGHVTSGGSDIFVTLPFKCSTISGVTVDANCIVNARGNSGYIKDSAGTDISSSYKFVSNLKCSQILQGNNGITSVIIKNIDDNAFTNVTNNTPVALEFLGNITLT